MIYYMSNKYMYDTSDVLLNTECTLNLPLYIYNFFMNLLTAISLIVSFLGVFLMEKKFFMLADL